MCFLFGGVTGGLELRAGTHHLSHSTSPPLFFLKEKAYFYMLMGKKQPIINMAPACGSGPYTLFWCSGGTAAIPPRHGWAEGTGSFGLSFVLVQLGTVFCTQVNLFPNINRAATNTFSKASNKCLQEGDTQLCYGGIKAPTVSKMDGAWLCSKKTLWTLRI
jgi:hypothetical protein